MNNKAEDNNPIILMDVLKHMSGNKEKWMTIKSLVRMINDKHGQRVVDATEMRLGFLKELQQDASIQNNYGIIISSTRGMMMTNDLNEVNKYIDVEEQRIKGIASKLKTIRSFKRRLENKQNYGHEDVVEAGLDIYNSYDEILMELAKDKFMNEYWEDTWHGDIDHTDDKEQLWEEDAELRKEWTEKYKNEKLN